jgi:hypothetical protein
MEPLRATSLGGAGAVKLHHFGGTVAATRCSSGSRIKIFKPEPHQNDAALQHLFFT